jgi:ABC-type hemin transport system ATPase subunit
MLRSVWNTVQGFIKRRFTATTGFGARKRQRTTLYRIWATSGGFAFKNSFGRCRYGIVSGAKKLLIMALKLSQIAMLHASNKETVVLLDDLTAELDYAAQQRLIERLSQLGSQVF